jgi:hypothetical protein
MLRCGNRKLGDRLIWGFGIPSVATCPGSSGLCRKVCYSRRLEALRPSMRRHYQLNLEATLDHDFENRLLGEIDAFRARVVRPHTAGDFYSLAYLARWVRIFIARPDVTFFFYTRSWRVPEIRTGLVRAARLANVRQWWSVDEETGRPEQIPRRVRVAYLLESSGRARTDSDAAGGQARAGPAGTHLVFKTHNLRRTPERTIEPGGGRGTGQGDL